MAEGRCRRPGRGKDIEIGRGPPTLTVTARSCDVKHEVYLGIYWLAGGSRESVASSLHLAGRVVRRLL